MNEEIAELIKRRRLQIMVHSYLYEVIGTNVISDYQWDAWAKELAKLQNENQEISNSVEEYKDAFADWSGDTASILIPHMDKKTIGRAYLVLRCYDKLRDENV